MIPSDPAALHTWFKTRPGSGQIATSFALEGLAFWIQRQAWRHGGPYRFMVADVGSGIGTTLACLAWWADKAEIVSVEDDSWCQTQARENLSHLGVARGILYYDKLPVYMAFDFVVLDGPQLNDWACLTDGATVFVEGGRRDQRKELMRALTKARRPFCWAQWKPSKDRSKGYSVYRLTPTIAERLWFLSVRIWQYGLDCHALLRGRTIGKRQCS